MPEMTGWEFRSWLQVDDRFSSIPIIVPSAERIARGVLAAAYVAKPFAPEDISTAVRTVGLTPS